MQRVWYAIDADEVVGQLNSSKEGLTGAEAARRLVAHGPNALPESRRRSLLVMLLGQFTDFMIVVLLAVALISGFIGEPQDTIAILVIVLFNAIIGAVQEYRAERAVAALREMAAPEAQVMRDGHGVTLSATDLVPGDVVLLEAGNIIPADLRLLRCEELEADESALTGESHPVWNQRGQNQRGQNQRGQCNLIRPHSRGEKRVLQKEDQVTLTPLIFQLH